MADIIAMFIPIVGFICLYGMVKVIYENRFRRWLVEAQPSDELIHSMFTAYERHQQQSSLKWGIVSTIIGVALVLTDLFKLDYEAPSTYGLIIIATGGGLLIYYWISRPNRRSSNLTS